MVSQSSMRSTVLIERLVDLTESYFNNIYLCFTSANCVFLVADEASRVKLPTKGGEPSDGYINASYIRVKYILYLRILNRNKVAYLKRRLPLD